MSDHTNIYLIGPMGSGKTAVGRRLATELGLEFFDSDAEIEKSTGVDIAYIFEREGEASFRQRERECIANLARPSRSKRISPGQLPDTRRGQPACWPFHYACPACHPFGLTRC